MTTKSMTVAEAGRLGGEKVKATRGREFFVEIGKKGGRAAKATGLDYREMGRRGGEAAKATGLDYAAIGLKGGLAVKEKLGTPFYERIGKQGGARVAALIRAGRVAAVNAEEDAIDAVVAGVSR